jgi:ribosome biogenesis GTPase
MLTGKVLRSTGSWYEVIDEDNACTISCRIVGKLKLDRENLTNPVAVGDRVHYQLDTGGTGSITGVLPRKNYIARQSPKSRVHLQLIACNIDQAVLVTSICDPPLKPGFIDRFLLTTEPQNIPALVVFNKWDLYGEEDRALFEQYRKVYEGIGYGVFGVAAQTGFRIDELRSALQNKTNLFSGQSGVGKSTLINCLEPATGLRTGELSSYTGKGTHTTTFAQMFAMSNGGFIIDTPGIKTLAFNNLEVMDVAHNFREFFRASVNCRFGSQCTHRDEPDCAVKEGLANGSISEIRYRNYLQILSEIESQNYWERNKKY